MGDVASERRVANESTVPLLNPELEFEVFHVRRVQFLMYQNAAAWFKEERT